MKILLCAATETEIAPTIGYLTREPKPNVDLLITGVGLLASTFALTKTVANRTYDLIIQAGVAGGLFEDEPLAKVSAVQTDRVGDLGVWEAGGFRSVFDLNLLDGNVFPWMHGKLVNQNRILADCGLPLADAVTVNEISTSEQRIGHYRSNLGVRMESMEGAALHYVALQANVPFLQIRSLSNFIGERDKTKWKLKEAIASLNKELQRILTKH